MESPRILDLKPLMPRAAGQIPVKGRREKASGQTDARTAKAERAQKLFTTGLWPNIQ
jgi:hypothetical protein